MTFNPSDLLVVLVSLVVVACVLVVIRLNRADDKEDL